jgi:hypothetical protein
MERLEEGRTVAPQVPVVVRALDCLRERSGAVAQVVTVATVPRFPETSARQDRLVWQTQEPAVAAAAVVATAQTVAVLAATAALGRAAMFACRGDPWAAGSLAKIAMMDGMRKL